MDTHTRTPRRKSSFLSLRRDTSKHSPAKDASLPPGASAYLGRPNQIYFDRYPKDRPSTSPTTPSFDRVDRDLDTPSPSSPSFDDLLFPGVVEDRFRSTSSPPFSYTSSPSVNEGRDSAGDHDPTTPNRRNRSRTEPWKASDPADSYPPPLRFSGSSSHTQTESPPQTPIDFDVPRTTRDRYPVVVSAPIPGVETMDALVDGMNGLASDDAYTGVSSSRSRFGIPGHHPLYQPPLPTPPPGVVLGGGKARRTGKVKKVDRTSKPTAHSESSEDGGDEDDTTGPMSLRSTRRRVQRTSTSRLHSSTAVTPTSYRSGPESSATPTRTRSAHRPSSANNVVGQHANSAPPFTGSRTVRSSSTPTPAPISHRERGSSASTPASAIRDAALRKAPSIDSSPGTVVPSISDIIKTHAPPSAQVRSRPSTIRSSTYSYSQGHSSVWEVPESEPEPLTADEEAELVSRSSIDSIADEVQQTLRTQRKTQSATRPLQHAHSFPNTAASGISDGSIMHSPPQGRSPVPSIRSVSAASTQQHLSPLDNVTFPGLAPATPNQAVAQYLRSARLTVLLKLTRGPYASRERPLTVSLSDLGSADGFPVVVFLGLGCVRHVMGLYDEMAECLGLRIITIDRWGLGRTDVPSQKSSKGIMEWACAVEEVLDTLKVDRCGVMAHSAGAPYALSFANKVPERIVGDICLLAPWVGGGEGGGYKWLKYVPTGILKTAQAAEWKLQAWMIGKPPTLAYEGIGYNVKTDSAMSPGSKMSRSGKSRQDGYGSVYPSAVDKSRPSIGSRSVASTISHEYDKLSDFDGRFESRSTLGANREPGLSRSATNCSAVSARRPSRGFLGKLKGTPSPQPQPQSPVTPGGQPPSSGKRLKALRSMGSLKGKSSSAPSTISKHSDLPTLQLPATPTFEGLGFSDIDWPKSIDSSSPSPSPTPISDKYARSADAQLPPVITSPRHNGRRSISFSAPRSKPTSLPPSPAPSSVTPGSFSSAQTIAAKEVSYQATLGNALIAASHAESAKGTHSDLLQILNHDHQPLGFSYTSYPHKVQVWYGDKDEKIAENAVRWMEQTMGRNRCTVKVVKGADHSLLYKSSVVIEVLERMKDAC